MLPEDFSSWVDLSEFLWSHSITCSRPSWNDLLQLQPTADLTGCELAMACRDLWPIAQGLVALKEVNDGLGGNGWITDG